MLPGVGERVVQLRVLETPRVVRRNQREKRGLTPGELEQCGTQVSVTHPVEER